MRFAAVLPLEIAAPIDQPCSDGEVSLVWRLGASFAEVSFPGNRTFYWYCTNGTEEAAGEGVPVEAGIPAALKRIMRFDSDSSAPIETSHAPFSYSESLLAA
jgi:hypothetical protein